MRSPFWQVKKAKKGQFIHSLHLATPRSPSISSFSHSFNKHSSHAYCVPGTLPGEHAPGSPRVVQSVDLR